MSEITPGDNQFKSIVSRINNLEDQKKAVSDDIRDLYAEAKNAGLNPQALRKVVRDQRADQKKAAALQADIDAYKAALGIV